MEAEEALEKYSDLFDFAPVGYFLWDRQGQILEVNLAGAALLGLDRGAAIRKRFGQFVAPEGRPALAEFLKRVLAADTKQTCQLDLQTGDPLLSVLVEGIATADRQGRRRLCRAAVIDITQEKRADELAAANQAQQAEIAARKQAEEAMRQAKEEWEQTFNTVPDFVAVLDDQHRIVRANRAMAKQLGVTPEQCVGLRCYEAVHGTDQPPEFCPHVQTCRDGREHTAEVFEPRLGGHFLVSTTPRFDEQGRLIGAVHVARDITDRKQAESVLQTTLQRFYVVLSSMYAGVLLVTDEGRVEFANQAFCDGFGLEDAPADLVGLGARDMIEKIKNAYLHPVEAVARIREIVDRGQPVKDEELAMQGGRTSLRDFVPLRVQGKSYGRLWLHSDITERKRAEEVLREAKAAAEAANEAKSRFLANISHELRTPMNAILGMVDLALQKQVNPPAKDLLQTAKQSADLLLVLLNDLLDSAKIDAGKLELESAPFRLRDVLDRTTQVLTVRAGEQAIAFSCQVAPDVPDALVGDQVRLRQILLNLAGNAIKFTERGEVAVSVRSIEGLGIRDWGLGEESRQPATSDFPPLIPNPQSLIPAAIPAATLEFSVRDTGIGIPAAELERIFHPFAQADASTTRAFGGTGLGLTISSSLVGLMGGRMWVESALGKGSTFFFTARFPLAAEAPKASKPALDVSAAAPARLRDPRGRGQPGQPETRRLHLAGPRPYSRYFRRRPTGAAHDQPAELRRHPHGRADAGHGRHGSDRGHSRPRRRPAPRPHHRHDRPRHEARPRSLRGRRDGRLPEQADQRAGPSLKRSSGRRARPRRRPKRSFPSTRRWPGSTAGANSFRRWWPSSFEIHPRSWRPSAPACKTAAPRRWIAMPTSSWARCCIWAPSRRCRPPAASRSLGRLGGDLTGAAEAVVQLEHEMARLAEAVAAYCPKAGPEGSDRPSDG